MQSFYTGLGGMSNFSKSLDNVSNNISNMNTPGFKGSDVFIRSLSDGQKNYGSNITSTEVRSQSGDLRQTGNDTDLAITGNGYFILKDADGEYFYTRAGQFSFDSDNTLVDGASGFAVMSVDSAGNLQKIDISEKKVLPPVATTEIKLLGNLDPNSTSSHEIDSIAVYDKNGEVHNLKMSFSKAADPAVNTWDVIVYDDVGTNLASFQIEFGSDSTPVDTSSSIALTINLAGQAQDISLEVGSPGSFSGATQLIGGGDFISASPQDGNATLGLQSISFKGNGTMVFAYADGKTENGRQIALANFNDPNALKSSSNGLLTAPSSLKPSIGKPGSDAFGSIQAKSLEMSNVDLTQEFADILIIQRGYQASSRVMSVSNDLLEQLYNSTRSA